jgi:LysR family transcriptional activator of nhaA
LDHAEAIFQTAEDLTATLQGQLGLRQALRVGALATLSRNYQIEFLRPVIGRSDVEVVLRSGAQDDLLRGLEALSLDVVLTNLAPARDAASRLVTRRLAEQPVSVVGRSERVGRPARGLVDLLSTEPLILPTRETALRVAFDAVTAGLNVVPNIAAEADDMAMMRLLVRADVGLAVLPPIVVTDELRSGDLTEAATLDGMTETFFAVTLERQFPNPLLDDLFSVAGVGQRPRTGT